MADKLFEQDPYKRTADSMNEVVKTIPTYAEIMQAFASGENEVELKRRFLLKKLDETWISAIEDCLDSLDQIIRNPQCRLEEKEEVLPTAISKHINGRTVIHLSQHTDYITDIKDDGMVIPSKLLNVFSEDTIFTYENKFINTLVNRLYAFVAIRYNGAKECGEDEKQTTLTLSQKFEHEQYNGKISLSIQVTQEPEEHEVIKNYIYSSDLWKRMERIYNVVNEYMSDPFIKSMGRNFVRSPVLRTNTILKNPLFKDCLSLWEFIESYEATGYEALIQEDLMTVNENLLKDIYNGVAEQYVVFQTHIANGFEDEKQLNSRLLNIQPLVKDEFEELNMDEFDYRTLVPGVLKNDGTIEYPEQEMEIALIVALAADSMMWEDEIDEEEQAVIDEKGEIIYKYKYSFLGRLIKAQLPTQDYYNEIKNDLLSYEGVKSHMSWPRETFKRGLDHCCRLNCKGKTLFVYLPLDPNEFDKEHYHHLDVSKEDGKNEYPFLLKVRSSRACKYAIELIAIVMERLGIIKSDVYVAQDFRIGPMSIEEMLEKDYARLIDGKAPEKKPEQEVMEDETEAGFAYKYIFSYSARLIRSGDERQELYSAMKNEVLSYNKVTSKISWGHELFKNGRNKICVFKVKGKTLCVYLPLNPDKYDQEHYHFKDVRVEGKETEYPLMMKITSLRAVKYCAELLVDVMAMFNLSKKDEYVFENFKLPYMSIEDMLTSEPVLAKLVDGQTVPVKEETKEEQPVQTEVEEENETFVKDGIVYRYKFSYSARLIRSGDERQELYNNLKNYILSYKKVNSKISWGHELFKLGRNKICIFKVKGKTLCVYMPLNPDDYDMERIHFKDMRVEGKDVEFPLMMKIKSERAVKYACELIDEIMKKFNIPMNDSYESQDYKLPFVSLSDMLTCEPVLAKLVENAPISIVAKENEEQLAPENEVKAAETVPEIVEEEQEALVDEPVIQEEIPEEQQTSETSFEVEVTTSQDEVAEQPVEDNLEQEINEEKQTEEIVSDEVSFETPIEDQIVEEIQTEPAVSSEDEEVEEPVESVPVDVSFNEEMVEKTIEQSQNDEIQDEVESNNSDNVDDEETEEENPLFMQEEFVRKYNFSYTSKLILSGYERQQFYNEIKNYILSYKKAYGKISWSHELFKAGRNRIALFKVKGKGLDIYLPLNPDNYDAKRLHFKDLRVKGKEVDLPLKIKVKSRRATKYAIELIKDVFINLGYKQNEKYETVNYMFSNLTIDQMIYRGLIKVNDGSAPTEEPGLTVVIKPIVRIPENNEEPVLPISNHISLENPEITEPKENVQAVQPTQSNVLTTAIASSKEVQKVEEPVAEDDAFSKFFSSMINDDSVPAKVKKTEPKTKPVQERNSNDDNKNFSKFLSGMINNGSENKQNVTAQVKPQPKAEQKPVNKNTDESLSKFLSGMIKRK